MNFFTVIKNFNFILICLLGSVIIFIYAPIFKESIELKQLDFQWSPSKLVHEGINHYTYMLEGNRDRIIGSQYGEYLHGLYIMLYPFTILSWKAAKIVWFIFNFILAVIIPFFLCKKFKLDTSETILIIFFFLTCSVTKAHLVIGQQSLFILLFISLPFVNNSKISFLLSGISYFKYSIGYVLFLNLLFSKKFKPLILTLIIPLLGLILYCYMTKSNIFTTALQPFQLAIQNHLTGDGGISSMPKNIFLFSFFEFFKFENKSFFALVISLITNAYLIFKVKKINDNLLKLSLILVSTLIFFPHYPHNFVLILPLLIYSVKNFNKISSKISFFTAIYFLSFFRITEIFIPSLIDSFVIHSQFMVLYFNKFFLFLILLINIYEDKIFKIKNSK